MICTDSECEEISDCYEPNSEISYLKFKKTYFYDTFHLRKLSNNKRTLLTMNVRIFNEMSERQ